MTVMSRHHRGGGRRKRGTGNRKQRVRQGYV